MEKNNKKLEKNLRYSIIEGGANSVKAGFGESFLSPYAIRALGASTIQVGLLASIPRLIGSVSQLFSSTIVELIKSRKKMITTGTLLQALMFIPIILVFFLQYKVWFLIFFVTIYWLCSSIMDPVWSSLMGDIVPDKIKGKYFGKRNRIEEFTLFISMLIAGFLLNFLSGLNLIYGFAAIFSVAMFARLISWKYFDKIHEPHYSVPDRSKFTFIDFIKKMRMTNYGIFAIYLCLMSFAIQISSPYSTVYMLGDLKLGYFTYTIVIAGSTISSFLTIAIWGKYADKFGNKKIFELTGLLISFVPVLYLFSREVLYLFIIHAYSGFVWAGFDLSSFNFVFDTVSPEKRVRCFSYCNVLSGIAVFLGAIFGGFLIRFGGMFWSKIYLVFLISGVLRLLVSVVFLPKIREVKEVKKISRGELLWTMLRVDVLEGLTYPIMILIERPRRFKKPFEKLLSVLKNFLNKTFEKK